MITFSCPTCREKFEVDDKQAGQMGKCPNCGGMMRVPQRSTNIFQIFKPNAYFDDKKLNALYVDFLKNNEQRIITQHMEKDKHMEGVVIDVRTTGSRSQLVNVFQFVYENVKLVGMGSAIGEIKYNETAVKALRSVDIFSMYTISLDADNTLLVSNLRLLDNLTSGEFAYGILGIAEFADRMEKEIFGSDTN